MTIKKSFTQQYSRKVKLLSQQTGTYGKGKVRFKQTKARKNTKKKLALVDDQRCHL